MIELEKTYLLKYLPNNLKEHSSKEIIDIYFPIYSKHPAIRLRKNGNKYEITKKEPINNDPSHQNEQTIILTKKEYLELSKIKGKKVSKIRYNYNGAEIDVFQDKLRGLVLVDFEFNSFEEKEKFPPPEYCLIEVTKEKFIAGGMLAGKKYSDIEKKLLKFNYKKKTKEL